MAVFQVTSRQTSPVAGVTGAALSRDTAIAALLTAQGGGGKEPHVYACDQIAASGPTGTFLSTYNVTSPPTGPTYSAANRDAAIIAAAAVGPTGPGAGIAIEQTTQVG
jgi:hypothetical protein